MGSSLKPNPYANMKLSEYLSIVCERIEDAPKEERDAIDSFRKAIDKINGTVFGFDTESRMPYYYEGEGDAPKDAPDSARKMRIGKFLKKFWFLVAFQRNGRFDPAEEHTLDSWEAHIKAWPENYLAKVRENVPENPEEKAEEMVKSILGIDSLADFTVKAERTRAENLLTNYAAKIGPVDEAIRLGYKVIEHKGEAIRDALIGYGRGPLKSCMTGEDPSVCHDLYCENPDVFTLIEVQEVATEEPKARAIRWNLPDGRVFLDRVYPSNHNTPEFQWLKMYAAEQGWTFRLEVGYTDADSVSEKDLGSVQLTFPAPDHMPYLDTFYHGKYSFVRNTVTVSNTRIRGENCQLHNQYGNWPEHIGQAIREHRQQAAETVEA